MGATITRVRNDRDRVYPLPLPATQGAAAQ